MKKRRNWCLIGIPDHEAVGNLDGRLGAAGGPEAFRQVFKRFSGRDGVRESLVDSGDAVCSKKEIDGRLEEAAQKVQEAHGEIPLSVVVGGGHDHGFSHLMGIHRAAHEKQTKKEIRIGCVNIDAHLDVRKPSPLISSGSPFYLAIESKILSPRRFVEFGIQRHCNGAALWNYVEEKKISVQPYEKMRNGKAVSLFRKALKGISSKSDAVVLSLDLDAAAAAFAPGVSAPQAEGFTSSEIIEMAAIAGRDRKVVSLGIFELNPEHDTDQMTARLAASAAYNFISTALRR